MVAEQPAKEEPERPQSIGVRLSNAISQWIDRIQPSSELVLIVTALIVGIGAGTKQGQGGGKSEQTKHGNPPMTVATQ